MQVTVPVTGYPVPTDVGNPVSDTLMSDCETATVSDATLFARLLSFDAPAVPVRLTLPEFGAI
jgi:hypothetical protein